MLRIQHSHVASWITGVIALGMIACSSAAPASSGPSDSNSNNSDQSPPPSSATPPTTPTQPTTPVASGLTLISVTPPSVPVGAAPAGQEVTLTGTGFVAG